MANISFFSEFSNKTDTIKSEIYIFWTSLVFYIFLWLTNPGNKIIALSYIFLIILYYHRLKNIRLSALLCYLASSIIFTGKRYVIELIPPGIFPIEVFPHGHTISLVISPQTILGAILGAFVLRDLLLSQIKSINLNIEDISITCFFLWQILSDVFGSIRPKVSLLLSFSATPSLILYFFIKLLPSSEVRRKLTPALLYLFASLIIFESLISFQQFLSSSPIYKNLETQIDIEFSGHTPDELKFNFRPVGTFQHANVLGMWLSFWIVILFTYYYKTKKNIFLIAFIIGIITLASTLSRSSWLGFILGFMFILWYLEKNKKIKPPNAFTKHTTTLLVISLILSFLFIFPRAEKSFYIFSEGGGYLRKSQIQAAISLIVRYPIFGVGSGMNVLAGFSYLPDSTFSSVALGVHNWFLLMAAEHGISILFLFFIFLITSSKKYLKPLPSKKNLSSINFLSLGFIGGTMSLLIVAMFQPFVDISLTLLFFAILGNIRA